MNAAAAQWLGIEVIRGSGTQSPDFDKKGGASAFREMLTALEGGYNVALTADVPKVARVCGLGIIKLMSTIRVPPNASDAQLEEARRAVEAALNEATARAYAIADRKTEDCSSG